MKLKSWTTEDFDEMSWHDNYVHALRIVEGQHGHGSLELDLDYILEWRRDESKGFQFLIARAELVFEDVFNLSISINFASATAAIGPFSIDGVRRESEKRERYTASVWTIPVNFPHGEIKFESSGFTQEQKAAPVLTDQQFLTHDERTST